MFAAVTLAQRVQSAATILLFAALILGVGLVLLRAIGKSSPARRRHGQFVLDWMLAGWHLGGAFGICTLDGDSTFVGGADAGVAGFGMLFGWAVGTVHGAIMLRVWPHPVEQKL